MSFLNYPSFVVNLDRCTERWESSYKRIQEAGFTNISRWKGIDAQKDNLRESWANVLGTSDTPRFSSYHKELIKYPGTQGCLLSHMLLWKHIIENKIEKCIVFEDDVLFHSDWKTLGPMYYNATPEKFHILYLGSQREAKGTGRIVDQVPVFCTHAYMITLEGAHCLTNALIHHPLGFYPIDCMLIDYMKNALKTGQSPFLWYSWNGTIYPSKEAQMEEGWDKRNSGLIFQDIIFPSDVRTEWDE